MTSDLPRFSPLRMPRPQSPPRARGLASAPIPDSPLYGTKPLVEVLPGPPFWERTISILQNMRDLTNQQSLEDIISPTREYSWLRGTTQPSSVLTMIQYVSSIYQRALCHPPTSFSSPLNHSAVEQICRGLEITENDATWVQYPGILLWIALTAGAAAEYRPERSYFLTFLLRIGTSAAWWGSEEARAAVLRFLWMKRKAEGLEGTNAEQDDKSLYRWAYNHS